MEVLLVLGPFGSLLVKRDSQRHGRATDRSGRQQRYRIDRLSCLLGPSLDIDGLSGGLMRPVDPPNSLLREDSH